MHNVFEMRVQTRAIKLSPSQRRAIKRADEYHWILFASKHAVHYFAQSRRRERGALPTKALIAVVGPKTAAAARTLGLSVRVVPEKYTAEDLIRALGSVAGKRILFPRSLIAPKETIARLRERGARVRVVPLYTTEAMRLSRADKRALGARRYARLIFKSPSGVAGLMEQLTASERKMVRAIPVEAIGPSTGRAAREHGFKKVVIKGIL